MSISYSIDIFTQVLHYEGYGSSYIKKHKTSPDAWAQMIKQLAFRKLVQRPPVVYESAQTRKFQLGRTEVIRSTSNETKAFVEAMEDPQTTVCGSYYLIVSTPTNILISLHEDKHRADLFRRAAARHLQYAAWAADGQGVDRHLFGLKKLLREGEPTPPIYTDSAYTKTNHWELSTSQLSSPWFDGWGYGEGGLHSDCICFASHIHNCTTLQWFLTDSAYRTLSVLITFAGLSPLLPAKVPSCVTILQKRPPRSGM